VAGITMYNDSHDNIVSGNIIEEGTGGHMAIGIHEGCPSAGNFSYQNTIRDNRIVGADYDILCSAAAQGLSQVSRVTRTLDAPQTAAPSTGHWEVGQRIEQDNPSSAGYTGWVCTVAGTFGAQTATNAGIDSGANVLTFANSTDAAKFHVGMGIKITGAGPASADLDTFITAFDSTSLSCTVLNNAGTTTTTATVSCVNPTFRQYGLIT